MATFRVWPSTNGPTSAVGDSSTTDLGVQFFVTQPGCNFDGFFFWCASTGTPDTTGSNYSFALFSTTNGTSGTLIGGTSLAASGTLTTGAWNYFPLVTPVAIASSTTYVAVVHYSGSGNHYTATASGWPSSIVNGPLTAPSNATALANAQDSFNEPSGSISFPATAGTSNYWLDVQVDTGSAAAAAAPAAAPDDRSRRYLLKRRLLGL